MIKRILKIWFIISLYELSKYLTNELIVKLQSEDDVDTAPKDFASESDQYDINGIKGEGEWVVFERIKEPTVFAKQKEKWVVVLDEPENRKLFEEKYSNNNGEWEIYYKPYDEFYKCLEIEMEKAEQEVQAAREKEIKNPNINEGIKRINSKESLVDYLLKEYYHSSEVIIDEYSTDAEVSEAKLKANYNELLKLKDKYI